MTRKEIDISAVLLMMTLCLAWALQQIALKAVAADVSTYFQVAIRCGIATLIVWLIMVVRKENIKISDRTWKPGLLAGLLFGSEFILISAGLHYTTASHMVVFLYTAPIFAALGLHRTIAAERLKPAQWVGIALAFIGIVVAFFGSDSDTTAQAPNMLLGDFLGIMGGALWGLTTLTIRTSTLSNAPATQTLFYQSAGGFVLALGTALFTGQTQFNPTPLAIWSILFQTLVVSTASYLVWFWMLRKYLASHLGVLSFMTPIMGVILGVLLLNEPLETTFIIGAALVLTGILIVSGYQWFTGKEED